MFLIQIHTKFKISVQNSTNSANIKIILNIRHRIMFLTQIHTDSHKSYISVHNSTGSANIKTILNIIFIIMR